MIAHTDEPPPPRSASSYKGAFPTVGFAAAARVGLGSAVRWPIRSSVAYHAVITTRVTVPGRVTSAGRGAVGGGVLQFLPVPVRRGSPRPRIAGANLSSTLMRRSTVAERLSQHHIGLAGTAAALGEGRVEVDPQRVVIPSSSKDAHAEQGPRTCMRLSPSWSRSETPRLGSNDNSHQRPARFGAPRPQYRVPDGYFRLRVTPQTSRAHRHRSSGTGRRSARS